jgi:AI-2 transport protein TqsA
MNEAARNEAAQTEAARNEAPEGDNTVFRILVGLAATMIIIAGLRAAAPVLVPLSLAAFLAVTGLPLLNWLRNQGVPLLVAVPVVVLLIVGLLVTIGFIATTSLLEIREVLPAYVERVSIMYRQLLVWLADHRIVVPGMAEEILLSPNRMMNLAGGLLRGFAGFMSLVIVVAFITLFLLAEAAGIPGKLRRAIGHDDLNLARYGRIMAEIQRYLAIKTATSLATGVLVGLWALFIGLDFPLFWGLTAFVLNYVPTVGSLVAAVPAVLLGLVQLGPGGAVLTAAGYLVVNVMIGNLIEPAVMGRGLGLSPFVVLLSLLFWGWVWGPIGMLLSLPLTMVLKIMLENVPDLAWVAVLMGPASDDRTAPRRRVRWWARAREA